MAPLDVQVASLEAFSSFTAIFTNKTNFRFWNQPPVLDCAICANLNIETRKYGTQIFKRVASMGLLDFFSDLCDWPRSHARKKLWKKQLQTVEIKVKMDCEGCERRVKKSVDGMKGVKRVEVDPKHSKLTVVGYVDPDKVLHRVRHRTGKKAEFSPYVPFEVVPHPYAPEAYDKKAPPGYVRNVLADPEGAPLARASSFEVKYTTAFSDENPNACALM